MTTEPTLVPVALGDRSYDILLGQDLLDRAGELLLPVLRGQEAVVVTDARLLATPHLGRLGRGLAAAGVRYRTVIVPPGEGTKSLVELGRLLDGILDGGADRRLTVVAFGGGVIGDLAGFAAAVLLRGLDFVQIPTTLLSQVDSSVGGKTGINTHHGKNLVGAFHQPRRVLIDMGVLSTLPRRELLAGYAELVKHAFIRDAALFAWLEANGPAVVDGSDPAARVEAISRSVAIKARIVEQDEHETTGLRALLNFGHTFAHAFEALVGYDGSLLHGEAVSLGMAEAFRLSARLGRCPADDVARALDHLRRLGLPTDRRRLGLSRLATTELIETMRRDKKAVSGRMTFVLSEGLGRATVGKDVPEDQVRLLLDEHARHAR